MQQTNVIPIFPLNVVLFPESKVSLRIFEPRYLKMVSRAIKDGSYFGIVKSRKDSNYQGIMATYVKVISWEGDDRGALKILVEGVGRCSIGQYYFDEYGLCLAKVLIVEIQEPIQVPEKFHCLVRLLDDIYEKFNANHDKEHNLYQMNNANWLSYRLGEVVNLPDELKQDILQTNDPIDRLEKIYDGIFASGMKLDEENNTLQ